MQLEQPRADEVEPEAIVQEGAELARGQRLDGDLQRAAEPEQRRTARAPARDERPRPGTR
jgi:hypothetical protein